MLMREQRIALRCLISAGIVMVLVFWLAAWVLGQDAVNQRTVITERRNVSGRVLPPTMTQYRGIKIGLTAKEVRDLIDRSPESADDTGYFYVFSDSETAQILLDKEKKVRAIAVTYLGKDAEAPTYEAVFGKDVPLKRSADGRIYNMVKYPELGIWIAYSSLGPEAKDPMVSITIQSLES